MGVNKHILESLSKLHVVVIFATRVCMFFVFILLYSIKEEDYRKSDCHSKSNIIKSMVMEDVSASLLTVAVVFMGLLSPTPFFWYQSGIANFCIYEKKTLVKL